MPSSEHIIRMSRQLGKTALGLAEFAKILGHSAAQIEELLARFNDTLRQMAELPDCEIEARRRSQSDLTVKRIPVRHLSAGSRQPVPIKRHTGQPGKRMQR